MGRQAKKVPELGFATLEKAIVVPVRDARRLAK
jgi:hypothetical protein